MAFKEIKKEWMYVGQCWKETKSLEKTKQNILHNL